MSHCHKKSNILGLKLMQRKPANQSVNLSSRFLLESHQNPPAGSKLQTSNRSFSSTSVHQNTTDPTSKTLDGSPNSSKAELEAADAGGQEVFSRAPGRESLSFDQAGSEGNQLIWLQVETFTLQILCKIFNHKCKRYIYIKKTLKFLFTVDFEQPQKAT